MEPAPTLEKHRPPPPARPPERGELRGMTFSQHLRDLRGLLLHGVGSVAVAFLGCWAFAPDIYRFLARPIQAVLPEGKKLAFFSVTDPFVVYAKVALLAGLAIASPYILFQLFRFLRPALYAHEWPKAIGFAIVGWFFFLSGGAFAYTVAFPFAVEFLVGLGEDFEAVISVQTYLKFLTTIMLGLGLMFELPVVIFLLAWMDLVTARGLLKQFRWAVVLIFAAAAIITPTPDVFNLCIFALPAVGLYLLGVAAAFVVQRRKRRKTAEAER